MPDVKEYISKSKSELLRLFLLLKPEFLFAILNSKSEKLSAF